MKTKSIAIAGMAVLMAGCANSPHFVYYSHRVMGLDTGANPSPTGASGHFDFGYQRKVAAILPKSEVANGATTNRDAVSVLAETDMEVAYLSIPSIRQRVATGDAAIAAASNGNWVALGTNIHFGR